MSSRTLAINDRLYDYIFKIFIEEPEVLIKLREETSHHRFGKMQISPEQGQFMAMIARLIDARRYLEVGTFTGYSSTVMALNMNAESEIICCDTSKEYTDVARRYWNKAGINDRISLHLAPAEVTLKNLLKEDYKSTFDIMFIDADKENYDIYYELGLELIRPGGLIAIDNVFWNGAVADPIANDDETIAIRAINAKISTDTRVKTSVVPIGDGLALIQKN